MRFLITSIPGIGHFQPLVPLALALSRAGHSVVVVSSRSFCGTIAASGLDAIAGGLDWDESRLLETLPEVRGAKDGQQGEWLMRTIFLDRSPRRMVPDLLEIIADWQPDMVVSGTYELGGALAAEIAGIPYASCSISFRWNRWVLKRVMGPAIASLRRDFGLPADPDLAAFGRYLDLCFVPSGWALETALLQPSLRALVWRKIFRADLPLAQRLSGVKAQLLRQLLAVDHRFYPSHGDVGPTTYFLSRHSEKTSTGVPAPAWLSRLPHEQTVYLSLGTVFSEQYVDLFAAALAGLRELPVNLILTVGRNVDPARFGPQPETVRIEQHIAPAEMAALLPHIDLCICHAGFGTVMAALDHGIPLVLLPLSADQPVIAQLCFAAQVAPGLPADICGLSAKGLPVVNPARITPAVVHDLVLQALVQPSYRDAARRVQRELAATPGPDHGVALLEELVRATKGNRP